MVRIRILPYLAEFMVPGPARLLDVLDDYGGVGLPVACRGAHCATCRVHVRRGQELLEPAGAGEQETLHGTGAAHDERLACQISLRPGVSGELELVAISSTSASAGS